jgi:hypothetical protein
MFFTRIFSNFVADDAASNTLAAWAGDMDMFSKMPGFRHNCL